MRKFNFASVASITLLSSVCSAALASTPDGVSMGGLGIVMALVFLTGLGVMSRKRR